MQAKQCVFFCNMVQNLHEYFDSFTFHNQPDIILNL